MTEGRDEYGDYSVDADNQPGVEENLDDELTDPLDRGYSPPERYSTDYGNTPWEEEHRETIDQRAKQEVPDPDPYAQSGPVDEDDTAREVGDRRAGRLVEPDEGAHEDEEKDLLADDVGIDGAASSAEEAAVHVIDDDEQ